MRKILILFVVLFCLVSCANKQRPMPVFSINNKFSTDTNAIDFYTMEDLDVKFDFVNANLIEVLDSLEKKGDFKFMYSGETLNSLANKITLRVKSPTAIQLLYEIIRQEKKLLFNFEDNGIIITAKNKYYRSLK